MATRFYEAAAAAFGHAQAPAPRELRWPYYLAQLYRTTGDQPRAVESFERAVELDPSYLAALIRLGELHLDDGRPEEAEPLFERALALDPASAPALAGVGRAALARGETVRAIDYLERALAVGPSAWNLHYNLATAYREAGVPARAEEHLSRRGGDPPEPPDPLMEAYESLLRSPRSVSLNARLPNGGNLFGGWTAHQHIQDTCGLTANPNGIGIEDPIRGADENILRGGRFCNQSDLGHLQPDELRRGRRRERLVRWLLRAADAPAAGPPAASGVPGEVVARPSARG